MSAFICNDETIKTVAIWITGNYKNNRSCGLRIRLPDTITEGESGPLTHDERATLVANTLLAENIKSVNYCYDDSDEQPWSITVSSCDVDDAIKRPVLDIIKITQCYMYQACEHDEWEASTAKDWCDSLIRQLICELPGYDAAPWGL